MLSPLFAGKFNRILIQYLGQSFWNKDTSYWASKLPILTACQMTHLFPYPMNPLCQPSHLENHLVIWHYRPSVVAGEIYIEISLSWVVGSPQEERRLSATEGKWDPSIPLSFSWRTSHACPEASLGPSFHGPDSKTSPRPVPDESQVPASCLQELGSLPYLLESNQYPKLLLLHVMVQRAYRTTKPLWGKYLLFKNDSPGLSSKNAMPMKIMAYLTKPIRAMSFWDFCFLQKLSSASCACFDNTVLCKYHLFWGLRPPEGSAAEHWRPCWTRGSIVCRPCSSCWGDTRNINSICILSLFPACSQGKRGLKSLGQHGEPKTETLKHWLPLPPVEWDPFRLSRTKWTTAPWESVGRRIKDTGVCEEGTKLALGKVGNSMLLRSILEWCLKVWTIRPNFHG